VQWMTAGRGIVHSEMPEQEAGRMAGFQLWVNLAAKDKMTAPEYRDIAPSAVPVLELDGGVRARVIAGASHGLAGAVARPTTEPIVIDIELPAGTRFDAALPAGHNAFVYVYSGAVDVGGGDSGSGSGDGDSTTRVERERMAILANDPAVDGVRLSAAEGSAEPARVLLVAGKPLGEPIAQYGPFVMNTAEELQLAFADFQRGALAV
ncbi:MAG: pirin family protein, partial [Pseudomonadota bacterium]|nr:pirin family protein [Pseudomonadota bacterium]